MGTSRAGSHWIATLIALAAGCTENAILEVEMDLPYDGAQERRFAVVQAVDGERFPSFDEPWFAQTESFDLADREACAREPSTTPSCNVRFHVATDRAPLRALHVRIRFCESPACATDEPDLVPELRYHIERPLHRGQVTRWTPSAGPFVAPRDVARVPARQPVARAPVELVVCACEIAGCWEGEAPPDEYGYCRAPEDGRAPCLPEAPLRHACEAP